MSEKKRGDLGRVVVIGGNGFLGHHIVNLALEQWTTTSISSIDLRCDRNRNPNAAYYECDITDEARLLSVLEDVKPDVVIHTASPAVDGGQTKDELFRKVNIDGTRTVVEACQKASVKALVYTSSASVISDNVHDLWHADERWPVIRGEQQSEYYSETKAAAEEIVIKANRSEQAPNFLTTSLRPAGIFGEADGQTLAGFLRAYEKGQTGIQIGDNNNLFDFTYVGNVAHAHLLAARLLLATAGASTQPLDHEKIDGEVFMITNDSPVYFWDFARAVWRAAGSNSNGKPSFTMSKEFASILGVASEIAFMILRKPPVFTKQRAVMSSMTRFYNINKAKRLLKYQPIWSLDEGVKRGVDYYLRQKAAAASS
ncbi:C-3 sterol dehydrogenase/C-4 decarboxylase family protein [Stachybotrys elegans]|uniref:Sterol-4-alpha-carboxylate 3-dehydrogenase ERG26, decarboxylating n=1 Tax=Stachybotrys elegans TaxID=80388 RepID=A0A8K0WVE0_9HYPO|nr:C-3 sterol dehydrogenase/C-4 decarboxylase family protein [Stachybotrys elegans]